MPLIVDRPTRDTTSIEPFWPDLSLAFGRRIDTVSFTLAKAFAQLALTWRTVYMTATPPER
jgi:hypothetical protein